MSVQNQIYIDVHPSATRVALTEDGELVELYIERNGGRPRSVGNIYKGTVQNVLAGMQAAFVNIGLERNGYLYVGGSMVDKTELAGSALEAPASLDVRPGETVMVQVVKDAAGTKGARVTLDVTVPGRFLVYMPYVDYIGISRKIEDEPLRDKLHKAVEGFRRPGSGFIVRTAAAGATLKELKQDAKFLTETFEEIKTRYDAAPTPSCLYNDGDMVFCTIRDMFTSETERITVGDAATYDYVKSIVKRLAPKCKTELTLHDTGRDMFEQCGIAAQVDALLQKKVWLKNGAYLVIDRTEALTVVDVNTGRFVGGSDLEETVFLTNMLAAREIARQMRLRNVGGIVVTDFIDMQSEEHQKAVVDELSAALKRDRVKSTVVGMTGLGLVEITRKKTRNETSAMLEQTCPYCGGAGVVYANEHVIMKIRAKLLAAFAGGAEGAVVRVNPELYVALFKLKTLKSDLEGAWQRKRIYVVPDAALHLAEFTVSPQGGGVITLPENAKLLYE